MIKSSKSLSKYNLMVAAYHKKLNEKMAWKKRERHNAFALYCDSTCCMSMFKMTKLSTQKMRRERALKSYCTARIEGVHPRG